jgi:hypothetical protein
MTRNKVNEGKENGKSETCEEKSKETVLFVLLVLAVLLYFVLRVRCEHEEKEERDAKRRRR